MPEIVTDEKETPVRRQLREEEEQTLLDYLQTLAAESPIRVQVIRVRPKTFQGRAIEGSLDTYDEPVSEEDIREAYGGGKYALKIMTPNSSGGWRYGTQRTITIAGDPKIDYLARDHAASVTEEAPSLATAALKMTQQMAVSAEERARKAEERSRQPQTDTTVQVLRDELSDVRRAIAEKDRQLFELMQRKPENTTESLILSKMLDGESSRITSIRTQVESEIRTLQARHDAEVDRINSRFDDSTRRAEDAHRRELDTVRASYDMQMNTLKISYEGQIQGFAREISHLDRELTAAKTELAELRARKDKGPVEQLTELAAMKEAIEGFSGGGEQGGGTVERLLSAAGPLVEGFASRIAQGPGATPQAQAQAQVSSEVALQQMLANLPVGQPAQVPDGRIVMKRPDGEIVEMKRKKRPPTPAAGEMPEINPVEVKLAVDFMEQALRNDTDPATFASTARNLVPEAVLALLRVKGVDYFMSDVAKLDASSPLNTQHGKNWTRKVASVLMGE